jgi:hypothetical protein
MKPSLCVLAVCCVALSSSRAAAQSVQPAGRILILRNDRTLEGEIICDGSQYIIRRPVGEITLPVKGVQKLCKDWDEAYAFVRSQANLRDPDERLRLARWCQQHGLKKQATEEASAAVQLRPRHAESQRLLKHLQRAESADTTPSTPDAPKAGTDPLPPIDLNSESLSLFTTRVQPILMNACANCHCSGRGGAFQLMRVASGTASNRAATQHNLTAVIRRVDLERPTLSPLLIKALSDHAGIGQAPIKKKESPAYRSLEVWLLATIASNPHLRELPELRRTTVALAVNAVPQTPQSAVTGPGDKPGFASADVPKQATPVPSQAKGSTLPPVPLPVLQSDARSVPAIASPTTLQPARAFPGPAAPAEPDAYDPSEFNRGVKPPRREHKN